MSKEKNCKKSGFGKFALGALVGAGLGILFAPEKGETTRKELKNKINELLNKAKEIDIDDVREELEDKLEDLKVELEDLDKEKVLKIAKKKGKEIQEKAEGLVNLAVAKGTPILQSAAEEVREKAIVVVKEVLAKLEKTDKK